MDTTTLYFIIAISSIIAIGFLLLFLIFKNALDKSIQRIETLGHHQKTDLATILSQRISEMDQSSHKSFERLKEDLGKLSRATDQMLDVGKTISSLEDLLKPPKIRGGMGETLLEELLIQILPRGYFEFQYTFQSGERVDAVIRLGNSMVPVDAKFPLEQFRKLIRCTDEKEAKSHRRVFIRNVKKHIDDIASKYILPDEGTYDFALMYIPAENVYYETIIKEENEDGLYTYALKKKVIPVSPNSFYAYLQVIIYGLKGMRIEEKAVEIIHHLDRLVGDQKRVREEFSKLGTHLTNARKKYEDTDRLLDRFEEKLLSTNEISTIAKLPPAEEK
jgi:DNA recombination protein RmuC